VVFDSSIRSSSLWRHFHVLRLTRPIRNAADPAYADWVDDLLFSDHVLLDPSQSIRRSFLSPLNLHVDNFNQLMMGRLPGSAGRFFATFSCDFLLSHLRTLTFSETYLSCDSVKEIKDTAYRLPPALHGEYIALLSEPGVPPHKLRLKVGAICSVMRNLCIEKGLVKKVRVRVAELYAILSGWSFYVINRYRSTTDSFISPALASIFNHARPAGLSNAASFHSGWHTRPRSTAVRA